jgi:hypothetical protein
VGRLSIGVGGVEEDVAECLHSSQMIGLLR